MTSRWSHVANDTVEFDGQDGDFVCVECDEEIDNGAYSDDDEYFCKGCFASVFGEEL